MSSSVCAHRDSETLKRKVEDGRRGEAELFQVKPLIFSTMSCVCPSEAVHHAALGEETLCQGGMGQVGEGRARRCVQGLGVLVCWGHVIKDHRWCGFNSRHLLSPSPGGWKSDIKALAGLVPLRLLSLVCRRPPSPMSSHGHPSVHVCVLMSSSYRDPSPMGYPADFD